LHDFFSFHAKHLRTYEKPPGLSYLERSPLCIVAGNFSFSRKTPCLFVLIYSRNGATLISIISTNKEKLNDGWGQRYFYNEISQPTMASL